VDSDILAPDSGVVTEGFINSADGTKLAYRAWPVSGAKIVFAVVHGLGEHSRRYERFARGMAEFQMATYAIDLRGHGKSAGQRGHIDAWGQWTDDAAALVKHAQAEEPGEVVPLGHSFGGVVMLSAMLADKIPNAKRFILSSPALRLKVKVPGWKSGLAAVLSNVAPKLAMSNEVDASTVSRIPEVVDAYRTDPLVHSKISSRLYAAWQRAAADDLERASEIKVPFLILAGTDDRLIDPSGSRELHERAAAMSDLRMLDGRYHEPFNDRGSDEVFTMIADWLRK
jgi:alpha-beta hydrolase superfamily lysophospholipase